MQSAFVRPSASTSALDMHICQPAAVLQMGRPCTTPGVDHPPSQPAILPGTNVPSSVPSAQPSPPCKARPRDIGKGGLPADATRGDAMTLCASTSGKNTLAAGRAARVDLAKARAAVQTVSANRRASDASRLSARGATIVTPACSRWEMATFVVSHSGEDEEVDGVIDEEVDSSWLLCAVRAARRTGCPSACGLAVTPLPQPATMTRTAQSVSCRCLSRRGSSAAHGTMFM